MQHLYQGLKELRNRAEKQLGGEDPLFGIVDGQLLQARKNLAATKKIIIKGMPMED